MASSGDCIPIPRTPPYIPPQAVREPPQQIPSGAIHGAIPAFPRLANSSSNAQSTAPNVLQAQDRRVADAFNQQISSGRVHQTGLVTQRKRTGHEKLLGVLPPITGTMLSSAPSVRGYQLVFNINQFFQITQLPFEQLQTLVYQVACLLIIELTDAHLRHFCNLVLDDYCLLIVHFVAV